MSLPLLWFKKLSLLSMRPPISTIAIVSSNSLPLSLLTCISILIFIHARVKCQFGPRGKKELWPFHSAFILSLFLCLQEKSSLWEVKMNRFFLQWHKLRGALRSDSINPLLIRFIYFNDYWMTLCLVLIL